MCKRSFADDPYLKRESTVAYFADHGARILTSSKCIALLKEQEEKKRKEKEEKVKRKLDRGQKRQG